MQSTLVVSLCIAVLAVIFAVQNTAPVLVRVFFWQLQGSLALVLMVSFVLGALTIALASIPANRRKNKVIADQKKMIRSLEESINVGAPPARSSEPVH